MYIRRNIRWKVIFRFAWKNLIIFSLYSTIVTILFIFLEERGTNIGIPFLPLSTIGIAVAFYIGFKNSQSYDRFWEGRKIWGGIVNNSRAWANQVLTYLSNPSTELSVLELEKIKKELVYRHLSWINALRIQLRTTTIFDRKNLSFVPDFKLKNDRDCKQSISVYLSPEEYEDIIEKANPAVHLIRTQGDIINTLYQKKVINDYKHVDMMDRLKELYDLQGMCERIKNTPFPRQYAYFSSVFVWLFTLLLPFGLLEEFHEIGGESSVWLTVPFSILISWVFTTMEVVGDNSEDPFENYVNDVPMSAICRTIEIDLKQMLHEPTIPKKMEPVGDVLL